MQLGNYLQNNIYDLNKNYIFNVQGKGLLQSIKLKNEYSVSDLQNYLLEKQIITKNINNNTLLLAPSLTIQKNEIDILLHYLNNYKS